MEKLKKLRKYMKEQSIDVCVIKHAENIALFTGYWPRNGLSYLVIGVNAEPMLIVPDGDFEDPSYGSIDHVKSYAWLRIGDGNPYKNVGDLLKIYKNDNDIRCNGTVGLDDGFEVIGLPVCSGEITTIGVETQDMIRHAFDTSVIRSVREAIVDIRGIKENEDIEKLEIVNEIGRKTCEYFQSIVKSGLREIDIASQAEAFFARTASGYKGCRYGKAWVQISSGVKTAREGWYAGLVSEGREIEPGDMVMLEMGAVVDGLWCDLTEVAVADGASDRQKELMTIVKEAQLAAINVMKPGIKASEAYQTAFDYIDAKGYGSEYPHGLGHGVGFMYHESVPLLGPGMEVVLQEGMVMSCEPGIYIEGEFGVRYEANVVITKDGCRVLGENS